MRVRSCPRCGTDRPLDELFCLGEFRGATCGWDLTLVPPRDAGQTPGEGAAGREPKAEAARSEPPTCPNGHPVEPGDLICMRCGADISASDRVPPTDAEPEAPPAPQAESRRIAGWTVRSRLGENDGVRERFLVSNGDTDQAELTLYASGHEPDPEVYAALQRLDLAHVAPVLDFGHWQGWAYEVTENLPGGGFAEQELAPGDGEGLCTLVAELGAALDELASVGLRHRDLRPEAVLIRSIEPLDLVIGSFGSARLSELDLEPVSPLTTSRYMAPEVIAGAVAPASDWWSLGMMLLEKLTAGRCFEGVNDQAMLIQVLVDGALLPDDLPPDVDLLLRGLLARDRTQRWQWSQVRAWLNGEAPPAPARAEASPEPAGPAIELEGAQYRSPRRYALAAAEAANWDEALDQLVRGRVATWAEDQGLEARRLALLRNLSRRALDDDDRLSLALKALNRDIPLVRRGEIVTPGWLTDHPDRGYGLLAGDAPGLLADLDAEPWLVQLRRRAEQIRERVRYHDIELVEDRLRVLLLSTSRARLQALWREQRRLFPDTDHHGLGAIADRSHLADEDLIVLLAAATEQYRTIDEVLEDAAEQAHWVGIDAFDPQAARSLLRGHDRRGLFDLVRERIADFVVCDNAGVNEWAGQFRLENRVPLPRALIILAVPPERWRRPPQQAYFARLLDFFEQKAAAAIRRGPLARMSVTRTGHRIDLTELGTGRLSAETLLNQVLTRAPKLQVLDPSTFAPTSGAVAGGDAPAGANQPSRVEVRLRNLVRRATLYRRDTGIDGLYLGFPFLLLSLPGTVAKPRIAPVLLWPVRLDAEVGRRGSFKLGFDVERDEVRLNPALEGWLGSDTLQRWEEAARSALSRSATLRDIVDEFGRLAPPRSRDLQRLPGLDVHASPHPGEVQCSAVLFHVAFMGQSVIEDLRQLKSLRPDDTALEPLLRMARDKEADAIPPTRPPELGRFFTVASDPSQEEAVLAAREPPGLVISGPPGTGKSQTIVNIIGDALGRKRSVLLVCQKQAALEVVHKRLEKEGLGGRCAMITDVNKDRRPVIKDLRSQLELLRRDDPGPQRWRDERKSVAARIEALEAEIDGRHQALNREDPRIGRSYRRLIGELVVLESSGGAPIDALAVRRLTGDLDPDTLARIEEQCAPLAGLWLEARPDDSPLEPLRRFHWDAATLAAFARPFEQFRLSEQRRAELWRAHPTPFDLDDPAPARHWLARHSEKLRALDPDLRSRLARWHGLFQEDGKGEVPALSHRRGLQRLAKALGRLAEEQPQPEALAGARALPDGFLADWIAIAEAVAAPVGLLGALSPLRFFKRRRLRAFLREQGLSSGEAGVIGFLTASRHEQRLRELRGELARSEQALGVDSAGLASRDAASLAELAAARVLQLDELAPLNEALVSCPRPVEAAAAARAGTAEAMETLLGHLEAATRRWDGRRASLVALKELGDWVEPEWVRAAEANLRSAAPDTEPLDRIAAALPRLGPFQRFRARTASLLPEGLALFRALAPQRDLLAALPARDLDATLRRIISREARLAWKARLEREHPQLLAEAHEIEAKVKTLAELDGEMRVLNRERIIHDVSLDRLAEQRRWDDITRLTGPRAKRLRELIDLGSAIGLMELRPVWLMNPNVASKLLPLRAGLFDLVIYDEASQMPVELALPTLYRGGTAIVSGDEKQLPPTAFFFSRVESDEAEIYDGELPDADADEEEILALEERWNRREIKDCPDLLALADSVLPTRMLEIHYRSNFRELIAFSNAAFYAGRLQVPVQNPEERVRAARPLELIRVDGRYEQQTNPAEAERVADLVADLWQAPADACPSVGVVTFNRKQADLIEERFEARAESDETFRTLYARERDRKDDGEDVGFFVKNLENVQGDERDVILFSTTFGRNAQGRFRRHFGVLGQTGGERRLNVAVTRARDKVILATSMPIAEVSDLLGTRGAPSRPRDYLQAYLAYAERLTDGDLEGARRLLERLGAPVADGDEKRQGRQDFFRELVGAFIRDELGYGPVDARDGTLFGIDWAITDPRSETFAIGIECGAPRHRLLDHARAREVWRPAVLGRALPSIHRVSAVGWYAEPEREHRRLADAISAALGQTLSPPEPTGPQPITTPVTSMGDPE